MKRPTVWGWSVALVLSAFIFALVVPQLPQGGPQSITLTEDTRYAMAGSFVTLPAGWELDIASTSGRSPAASDDGLRVHAEDAVWFGSSQDLVNRVAELTGEMGAEAPEVPDDAAGESREVWTIQAPATDTRPARRIDVVRHLELVVLAISEGDADALARPEIGEIVDSVDFEEIPLEVHNYS